MLKKTYSITAIFLLAVLIVIVLLYWITSYQNDHFRYVSNVEEQKVPKPFQDEDNARTRFNVMISTLQKGHSLSYESEFKWKNGKFRYSVQLKKPNYFRLEGSDQNGKKAGVMIGDGNDMWIYWHGKRPWYVVEDRADYLQTSTKGYMKIKAPPRKHSIKAEASRLSHNMGYPVIDPSLFHMCNDTLLDHIDAIRTIGTRQIDGSKCTGIEISFMEGQRSWYLWLSDRDNIPRELKEVIRAGANTIVTTERYLNISINKEIENSVFKWRPPADWKQVILPGAEENMLKVGQIPPEIASKSVDGESIKLSAYKGRVVWMTIWRVGCPPCRMEMPMLEHLYNKYTQEKLVVLGVNCIDDRKIACDFLDKNNITFPNIVDSSPATVKLIIEDYSGENVPANIIIGKDGRIVDRWYGYSKDDNRGPDTIEKLLGKSNSSSLH